MDQVIKMQEVKEKDITEQKVEKQIIKKYDVPGQDTRMTFRDAEIDEDILKAVLSMGFENMSPIQEKAIPVMLEGRDIIGQAQTGTGKTAAFGIPMIQRVDPEMKKLQGIVLCPTRELAIQAAEEIRKLAKYKHGIKVLPVYGGQDINRQIRALSSGVQIIVGTPGRVIDHMRRHTIKTGEIRMIILDEADEMLNMGFREDIETILKDMPKEHQMALFSATMPEAILQITHEYQSEDAEYIRVTPKEITVSAIKQAYYRIARQDKKEAICRLLDYYQPIRSLIFCNTKKMVDEMAEFLKERGYQAEGLHGDLSQYQRDTVMNSFRNGRCNILIATDVAARGIDVRGVDAVFNYDVPEDIEYYVHRIGRTGRAGKAGRSFTLVSGREIYKIRDIEKICHTMIQERKLPAPKDILSARAKKVFAAATEIYTEKDLERLQGMIEREATKKETDPLTIAAALLYMNVGEEPEELQEERSLFDRVRRRGNDGRRRDGGRNRAGEGRRSRDGDRSHSDERRRNRGEGRNRPDCRKDQESRRRNREYRGGEKREKRR